MHWFLRVVWNNSGMIFLIVSDFIEIPQVFFAYLAMRQEDLTDNSYPAESRGSE